MKMETAVDSTECARPLSCLLEEVCQQSIGHNGILNSVSDGECVSSPILNKDFNSSEDGDNTSECFENTIIELEELIGNEEEFRLFIESMSGGEDTESVNPSQILDLNSNIIKDKTEIQVIDITSDDEELEEESTSDNSGLMTSHECLATPVHNVSYSDQESPVFNSPMPASFPTSSDLISLGVKDVTASFLNYKNPNKSPLAPLLSLDHGQLPNSLVLNASDTLFKNDTSCKELNNEPNNSITEDSGNLNGKFSSKLEELKDLLDENCNALGYYSDLNCVNSPSPKTEEMLLADTNENNVQTPASAIPTISNNGMSGPTSLHVREDNFDSDTQTSSSNSNEPVAELINCEETESNDTKDIHSLSFYDKLDIEPVAELINSEETESNDTKDNNSLSFYDKLDIEPFGEQLDSPVPLPSPPPQELVDEVASLLETKTSRSPENPDKQSLSECSIPFIGSKHADVDNILKSDIEKDNCVSNLSENSKPLQSSPPALPAWQVPWVSTDAAENEDNNDPEWDLLRKLETDEERYRVVREKWRQLEIPDPRRDLTCHNYRRSRSQFSMGTSRQSRKRRRSLDESGNEDQASKRRRMVSCTMMYESRINDIRGEIDNQFMQLRAAHSRDLQKLSVLQQQEHQKFFYSAAPGHIVQRQMNDILHKQDMEIQDLNVKYDAKLQKISKDKQDAIYLLKKASKEVLAFNKFYNDLGSTSDDHCDITEEEFQQFNETEQMYELYNSIYNG